MFGGKVALGSDVTLELVLMVLEKVLLLVLHEVRHGGCSPSPGNSF